MVSTKRVSLRILSASLAILALISPSLRSADLDPTGAGKDAAIAMKIDFKQLMESGLFKKYALEDFKKMITSDPKAQEVFKATGLDPLKDVNSVSTFISGSVNPQFISIIRGTFDAAKINAAIAKESEKDGKTKSTKLGDLTYWEMGEKGQTVTTVVSNPTTILASNNKETLQKVVDKTGESKLNPDLLAALKGVPEKSSFMIGAIITDEMKKLLGNVPPQFAFAKDIKSMTANVNVTDEVALGVNVSTSKADAAKATKDMIEQGTQSVLALMGADEKAGPIIKDLVDKLKVTQEDTSVSLKLVVSENLIKKIIALKP